MTFQPFFLQRLELTYDADERAIRRAYARELKLIDQEKDADGFQSLRESYDAALYWVRNCADIELDEPELDVKVPSENSSHDTTSAYTLAEELNTEASTHASTSHSLDPEPAQWSVLHKNFQGHAVIDSDLAHIRQQLDVDHEIQADEVFSEFLQRCNSIADERPVTEDAPWQRELHHSLADERLINIVARTTYERHVADLLIDGWKPGHEALFVAALKVFGWTADRQRVSFLGRTGAMLDAAIDQFTMFNLQSDSVREPQRRLIERLRSPEQPGTRELILNAPTLGIITARFPVWLALITDTGNIINWRELNEKVPKWRRKLTFTGISKSNQQEQATRQSSGINWNWLIIVAITALFRVVSSNGDSHTQQVKPVIETTANYFNQGTKLLDNHDYEGAISAYSKAIALDHKNAMAYANRALAYYWNDDFEHASKDLDMTAKLDAADPVLYRVRGLLALRDTKYPEAITAFTRALELDSQNSFSYYHRALAYNYNKQAEKALVDINEAIRLSPQMGTGPYRLRAQIYLDQGNKDKAADQAKIVVAANPNTADAYYAAAQIYTVLEQHKEAVDALDRGIAVAPDISNYLFRANLRVKSDTAGRQGNIDAALALDPHSIRALEMRSQLETDTKNFHAAAATLTSAISEKTVSDSTRADLLVARGVAYTRMGKTSSANMDFAAARQAATSASALNSICWLMATNNVALQTALDNCEISLAQRPNNGATLDSKGFVLLRMGRYREAVATYNAALELKPGLAASLFGRSIGKRHLGDPQGAKTDLAAAEKTYPGVVSEFAEFGITP